MSRTYRRKNTKQDHSWILREYVNKYPEIDYWFLGKWGYIYLNKDSTEGKRRLAKHHSDAGYCWQNYRGPHWFHNMFEERPRRQKARREIHKFMKDPDYEVMLEKKKPVIYWL